jgi:glycosyltransferase involved in cell wall biosynthesis
VLITISEHSRQYYLHTAGRFLPGLAERTIVIPNGIDWDHFRPTRPDEIVQIAPVDPQRDVIVLHPHRPEPSKGLPQTIEVVDLLVKRHGVAKLKVLVPRWLEAGLASEIREFVQAMQQEIEQRGLAQHFIFHDWAPQRLMPQDFSLGAVTLALGPRFIDVGIAEQAMVGAAAGLALRGRVPVCHALAAFLTMRENGLEIIALPLLSHNEVNGPPRAG